MDSKGLADERRQLKRQDWDMLWTQTGDILEDLGEKPGD